MFPTFFLRGKLHPWEDKTGSRWEGQARAKLIFCWGEEKKVPFSTQFKCKEVSVWESNSNMEIYTAIFNYCFLKTTGKKTSLFHWFFAESLIVIFLKLIFFFHFHKSFKCVWKCKPQSFCSKMLKIPFFLFKYTVSFHIILLHLLQMHTHIKLMVSYLERVKQRTYCQWPPWLSCRIRPMGWVQLSHTQHQGHHLSRAWPNTSKRESCRANPWKTVKFTGHGLQNHDLALYLLL